MTSMWWFFVANDVSADQKGTTIMHFVHSAHLSDWDFNTDSCSLWQGNGIDIPHSLTLSLKSFHWKMVVGRRSFPIGKVTFQGRTVKLRSSGACSCTRSTPGRSWFTNAGRSRKADDSRFGLRMLRSAPRHYVSSFCHLQTDFQTVNL